ncbi:MAG: hypothetical protein VYD54_00820 [Bdellovibrionota bacterium]|nr:hypothetical protein [Bdellovibrionota bacterium]
MKKLILFCVIFMSGNAFSLVERGQGGTVERIRYLDKFLSDMQVTGLYRSSTPKKWRRNFLGLYGAVAGGSLYMYLTSNDGSNRFDAGVNFVKASIGVVDHLFNPLYVDEELAEMRQMEDGFEKLKRAEAILKKASEREMYYRSWTWRLTALTINAAGGFAIWVGDERPMGGIISFLLGTLISELQIRGAPKNATEENFEYRKKFGPAVSQRKWWHDIKVYPISNGIGMMASF